MTEPFVSIDTDAAEPPFEQIRRQVIDGVRVGRLTPGDKLPTVRGLALELGLAANTVAKAYRALEADGVIETHGRSGSFVSTHGDPIQQKAQAAARDFAQRMAELRVDAEDALAYVQRALGIR
ncbi:DNA-binding transcriptional regulator YhcF, GntR family [Paramicrobacterium humi]|uniref:DNA-binding transcriptional regulator YhcF, GntR family n=1 Tax=Paramicrobacterium humi TaxID=640635 RepID=A0A1H4JM81_9MICO|nr:GntR family transcriptional regulator [Microbacterium humi]SEB46742.1 DNA-binding transcriptional regulator YhcF, GntR family [Microbacterium humi]